MNTIATITELLTLSDCQYRIFDLGRRIEKITKETFEKLEHNQLPHPVPVQGHAHFAVCFWQKASPTPYLWFVKLPLDERGLLNQGARNHFIAIIVEALGTDLSVNPTEKQEELLKNNPYIFTPSQYKLAMLNSLLNQELKQPASTYYADVVNYFEAGDYSQWHHLGAQGITDYAARIKSDDHIAVMAKALSDLPMEVLSPLCSALENLVLPIELIDPLTKMFVEAEPQQQVLVCRALASSIEHPYCQALFTSLLQQETVQEELMITIAGRCWQLLGQQQNCLLFLEQLAANHQQIFPAIFKDLVAIPNIRPYLFNCMRDTQRSNTLAKAIGTLFN